MAERRRRRQPRVDNDVMSEGESQEADQLSADSNHPSDNEFVDMSEYDSAEDENYEDKSKEETESEDEADLLPKRAEESAIENDDQEDDDDDGLMRESGDGKSDNDQEGKVGKKVLKISEDRNSPLFIPTKGNFYQHDVRSDSSRQSRRGGHLIHSNVTRERWLHDKYDEGEQAPKTRDELIEEYGYDIRTNKDRSSNSSRQSRRPSGRRGATRGGWRDSQRNENHETRPADVVQNVWRPFRGRGPMRSRNFHAKRNSSSPRRNEEQADRTDLSPAEPLEQASSSSNFKKPSERLPERRSSPQKSATHSRAVVPDRDSEAAQRDANDSMNNILDVINNKEQEKVRSMGKPRERPMKPDVDRMKNLSISKESTQPKRYSSLRQRASEPVANQFRKSSSPRHRPARSPKLPPEWVTRPVASQEVHSRAVEPEKESVEASSKVVPEIGSPNPVNYPTAPQSSVSYSNPSLAPPAEPVATRAPPGIMLAQLPTQKMEATLAQMQWYEAAALAYQQAMMSQGLLTPSSFVTHQTPPHEAGHSIGESPLLLNSEAQTASPPQIRQLRHPAPQGDLASLGSLAFQAPLPPELHPNNFQQRIPDRNVVPPSMQVPFPPSANLISHQVGGVTYYPNPLQQMQVPGGAPMDSRLTAAIPIKHPIE